MFNGYLGNCWYLILPCQLSLPNFAKIKKENWKNLRTAFPNLKNNRTESYVRLKKFPSVRESRQISRRVPNKIREFHEWTCHVVLQHNDVMEEGNSFIPLQGLLLAPRQAELSGSLPLSPKKQDKLPVFEHHFIQSLAWHEAKSTTKSTGSETA